MYSVYIYKFYIYYMYNVKQNGSILTEITNKYRRTFFIQNGLTFFFKKIKNKNKNANPP